MNMPLDGMSDRSYQSEWLSLYYSFRKLLSNTKTTLDAFMSDWYLRTEASKTRAIL